MQQRRSYAPVPETEGRENKQSAGPSYESIGTAWLVLSHAAWLGAALTAMSVGTSLIALVDKDRDLVRPMAIALVALGILLALWTVYAVAVTWNASRQLPVAIFSDLGFTFLLFVVLATLAMGIWCLVVVCRL